MDNTNFLKDVISTFEKNTREGERFTCQQTALNFKTVMKRLYDFTKEITQRNTKALPELIIENFDDEQIWQQLELQNESEIKYFLKEISKILSINKKLMIPITCTKPESVQIANDSLDSENKIMIDEKEPKDKRIEIKSSLRKQKFEKRKKISIVDDKFFKLQELDEYLTKQEKKEKQKEDDTGSEESVDFFDDFSEDEDCGTDEGNYLKYTDFFDSPESDDEAHDSSKNSIHDDSMKESDEEVSNSENGEMNDNKQEEDDEMEYSPSKKRVKFNLTNDSDETDSLENKTHEEKEDTEPKSSLEARQSRLYERIQELEEEAVGEKPWQLKGEISGSSRPQNSLLEEFVEFDAATRPAPVITEQTTMKLEDIIKQRIKDKTWDDVEKKFKPIETPLEYKKKLILNQEKSKESLSQIYENEYLKQKQALKPENNEKEEEEPELHKEIRKMMYSVMSKLDALSNYHYTPKRAKPEIKIISHVPAINMEEVAPVATSDATLLAPEEIKAKSSGDLIGKSERTKTDMKRNRRRKKLRQRAKQQNIEKTEKLNALKPGINKRHKEDNAALLKKLVKDRNITLSNETTQKVVKSSTAFFTQLQDQVKVKAKHGSKKKDKKTITPAKLKL